jgi:predicted GNAT superfamily acetyltransferase
VTAPLSTYTYRQIEDLAEIEAVVDLEIVVWSLDPRDAVPSNILHAMVTNGYLLVGAFHADRLIGMAFGFPARRGNQWILWSHMAAVHPDYQGQGIGYGLKQFQRDWAVRQGYKMLAWTFDPLQRGNANFNLNQLGATAQIYHVNFYGEMTDGINAGLPSDRLEVQWAVRKSSAQKPVSLEYTVDNCILLAQDDLTPALHLPTQWDAPVYLAEIPHNLTELKQANSAAALAWRLALRVALQRAFSNGYIASDFVEFDGRACYVLSQSTCWYLYVLECSDSTLYTGITPTLQQRLDKHNAGRGAAYTAARRPVRPLAAWQFVDRSAALKAERAFKKLSRTEKLRLIAGQHSYRDAAFVTFDGK